ncbi:hypothetical protein FWF89_02350 [Candidatus Saccharibacteria bacterium]|nr:hypothetical protein [Candidatus Saccharibacteria bacterium]
MFEKYKKTYPVAETLKNLEIIADVPPKLYEIPSPNFPAPSSYTEYQSIAQDRGAPAKRPEKMPPGGQLWLAGKEFDPAAFDQAVDDMIATHRSENQNFNAIIEEDPNILNSPLQSTEMLKTGGLDDEQYAPFFNALNTIALLRQNPNALIRQITDHDHAYLGKERQPDGQLLNQEYILDLDLAKDLLGTARIVGSKEPTHIIQFFE